MCSKTDCRCKCSCCAPGPSLRQKLLDRITVADGGCLLWEGALNADGYGVLTVNGRKERAHRLAYTTWVGPIGEGLTLDHLCRVKRCVSPLHLEQVSIAENSRRGNADRPVAPLPLQCSQGHLFDDANTYINPSGARRCRACNREGQARRDLLTRARR